MLEISCTGSNKNVSVSIIDGGRIVSPHRAFDFADYSAISMLLSLHVDNRDKRENAATFFFCYCFLVKW